MMGYGGWSGRYCAYNTVFVVSDISDQARGVLQPHIALDPQGRFYKAEEINDGKYKE